MYKGYNPHRTHLKNEVERFLGNYDAGCEFRVEACRDPVRSRSVPVYNVIIIGNDGREKVITTFRRIDGVVALVKESIITRGYSLAERIG